MTQYNLPEDVIELINGLRKRVENLEKAPRLQNATVDKGALQVKSADGKVVAVFGDLTAAGVPLKSGVQDVRPDGSPQMCIILYRDTGQAAFSVIDPAPNVNGYQQFWALYDLTGKIIMSDDVTTGYGLATPWIPVGEWMNTDTSKWPTTTVISGWISQWQSYYNVQHPKLYIDALLNCTGTALGSARLLVNSVQYGPTIVASAAGYTLIDFVATLPQSLIGTTPIIELQTTMTSGAGSVQSAIRNCYGRQS